MAIIRIKIVIVMILIMTIMMLITVITASAFPSHSHQGDFPIEKWCNGLGDYMTPPKVPQTGP